MISQVQRKCADVEEYRRPVFCIVVREKVSAKKNIMIMGIKMYESAFSTNLNMNSFCDYIFSNLRFSNNSDVDVP